MPMLNKNVDESKSLAEMWLKMEPQLIKQLQGEWKKIGHAGRFAEQTLGKSLDNNVTPS